MNKISVFQNSEEKQNYISLVNESNCSRVMIFAPVQILIMLYELGKDIVKIFVLGRAGNPVTVPFTGFHISYHNLFAIIELFVVLISAGIFIINIFYKKNKQKHSRLFHKSVIIYCSLLLLVSFTASVADVYAYKALDLNYYYFVCLVITALFYISPEIVVPEIVLSNSILWILLSRFKWDSVFSPYKPYCVFLLMGFCIVAVFKSYYLLQTLRREEKIKKFKQEAERRDKLKSLFLANMSHEIRTPMNAIVGMSELALDYNLSPGEKNNLRQIHSSALALLAIINDILDFSKIESGKMEVCSVDFDLLKTVYDIANVAKVKIQGKNIRLVVEIDPGLSVTYNGDDLRLRQILINLAGNAAKFTEKGYVIIRVENLQNYEHKEGLRFNVIDSGEGIKEEDLKKLFNAFQQVDMKANRTKEGTGLGLSISKNLIQLMGGNIGVRSEYGKGSCFFFNLPFKAVSEEKCGTKYKALFDKSEVNEYHAELRNLPVASLLDKGEFAYLFAEKNNGTTFTCPEAKILVVDDNETNLDVAKGLLHKFGIEAVTAESGFEALKIVKQKAFDLIFMDHQMPVMDGIETLKKLREEEKKDGKHSLVIALSANAVNGAKEMFHKNGFDDFLAKPVQGKDFARCLKKWLKPELIQIIDDKKADISIPEDFIKPDESKVALKSALDFTGGFENWLSAAKSFYRTISSKASEIRRFKSEKDYKNFTIAVHALKSSARIIGATELSELSKELEASGNKIQNEAKESLESEISTKTEKLLELYESYIEILQPSVFYEKKSESAQKASDSEINTLISSLKSAAEDNDLTSTEEILKKLNSYELPEDIKKQLPLLQEAAENIDFDRIKEILG